MNKVYDGNFWECYDPQRKAPATGVTNTGFIKKTVPFWIIPIRMDLAWSFAQAVPLSFVTCQNTNSKTASGCKAAATAEKNR